MSKLIKITPECVKEILEEFQKALDGMVMADGKITFTKSFNATDRKASLCFTELAWLKMQALIREFDKEVAWHGIARRSDDTEKDEYIISDILVYPQEVTSATVNTDQQGYEKWLMELDDETFNNLRMQGHSHVNMSTSPSGVDLTHQKELLDRLDDDMFYIFLIWNKKNERTIKIYDFAKNIMFETSDVTVSILEEENGIQKFISNAKDLVKDRVISTPTTPSTSSYNYGGYNSGGWNSEDDGWYHGYGGSYYKSETKSEDKKANDSSKKDKKGWRKGHKGSIA